MNCESCGIPMEKPEDHGGGDLNNKWCVYCCKSDGTHKSKRGVREGMIQFHMKSFGKSRKKAEKDVDEHMRKMPAWKE